MVAAQVANQVAQFSNLSPFQQSGIHQIKLFAQHIQGIRSQQVLKSLSGSPEEYTYLVSLDESSIDEFVRSVKDLDSFVHVQPNFTYTTMSGTTEPSYDEFQKTGMELMHFPDVWSTSTGAGITVAVLDTGINVRHREFCNTAITNDGDQTIDLNGCTKLVAPFDFIDDAAPSILSGLSAVDGADYDGIDGFPDDKDGHGTHVAGIIGANGSNSFGITGAAYDVSIMPIRVMAPYKKSGGQVTSTGQTDHIIQGVNYAVTNNADIINMSLGGVLTTQDDLLLQQAIDNATVKGVLVVAAAGNDNVNFDDARVAPAYYTNTLTVASVTQQGEKSSFSNYGESLDVAAFGGEVASVGCDSSASVYSTGISSNTSLVSLCGTSMAAPYVAALAAIIKSYYKVEKNQTLTPSEIRRLIQISAALDLSDKSLTMGHGVIDARQALFIAGASGLEDPNAAEAYVGSSGKSTELICYPNPFDTTTVSQTHCNYQLNMNSSIQWWLFSRRGELIKTESTTGLGAQTISWDGRDRNFTYVPNGVYQLVLKVTPDDDASKQVTLKHLITVFR